MDYWEKLEALRKGDGIDRAVAAIAEDIRDRKGIGNELEAIDDDTVCDMLDTWRTLLLASLSTPTDGEKR